MTKKILVVDDDRGMVGTLCDILELHGWQSIRSFDGEGVAELAEEHAVDVVLMDVRMPKKNGVDTLEEIKARRPQTRVILMTAYAAKDLLERAERDGALRILRKPVDLPELFGFLDAALEPMRRLLVVDDDPEYLKTLCEALTERGVETLRARTLDEALKLLARAGPGAVLLDLKLDHVDPQTSLLAIREVNPSVLLILYSGHGSDLTRTLDGLPQGLVDAAFLKPLSIEQLVARLHG